MAMAMAKNATNTASKALHYSLQVPESAADRAGTCQEAHLATVKALK